MADTKKTSSGPGFSAEEKAAMKQRAAELKASAGREAGAKQITDAIANMTGLDKQLAQQLHEVILAAVPEFGQKTYYGFPAYTINDKTILFFKPAAKFKERYATLAFEAIAHLDDGTMWPTSYAVTAPLGAAQQKVVTELVRKAVG